MNSAKQLTPDDLHQVLQKLIEEKQKSKKLQRELSNFQEGIKDTIVEVKKIPPLPLHHLILNRKAVIRFLRVKSSKLIFLKKWSKSCL